ncbi:MAG: hypothetical protein ACO3QV_05810 [Candidatus Nanopelagicaceae bacterium]
MMKSSRAILVAFFSLLFVFTPTVAHSIDIPLLTWERGKEQNLVLGGNTDNEWKIELVDEANDSVLEFSASDISANGFVVYSAFIPSDFPLGAYAVRATGIGIPASIVAGVNIVTLNFYELVQIPFELLWIFMGYIFVTAAFGVMRLRRYGIISARDDDVLDPDLVPPRLTTFYRLRESATRNIDPSLLQVVLRREGEWLRDRSLAMWSLLPLLGFALGLAIGVQMLRSGGLGNAPWLLLFFGAMISVVDLYSGIIGFAGLVLSHLIFGDVVSLRDVMALIAVGLGWSGAYALGTSLSLLQEKRDVEISSNSRRYISAILSGLAASIVFHSAQILILSLVVTVSEPAPVDWLLSSLLCISVIGKVLIRPESDREGRDPSPERIDIPIGRVVSPRTVTFLLIFFSGTLYIWIRDWISAIALALALTAPYALLLVRFGGPRFEVLNRLPRNPLVEALVVSGIGFAIFYALEDLPFEVLERSRLFLILGVIPVLMHSLYSILWDIQDRAERESFSGSMNATKEEG